MKSPNSFLSVVLLSTRTQGNSSARVLISGQPIASGAGMVRGDTMKYMSHVKANQKQEYKNTPHVKAVAPNAAYYKRFANTLTPYHSPYAPHNRYSTENPLGFVTTKSLSCILIQVSSPHIL